jgi:ribonucleoside-triphosphate reductase
LRNNVNQLPTNYQEFIYKSRYSRWLPEEGRRENWNETVDRYISFFKKHLKDNHGFDLGSKGEMLKEAIVNLEVMPSMRALMTAGKALERDHVAGYNCAYTSVDSPRAFDEALQILMNGTGVGFSVEEKFTSKLPTVAESFHESDTTIVVRDSKNGWAKAYKELLSLLYSGNVPKWDVSGVRPKGARLRTFGGRASGPEPLEDLFKFSIETFKKAAGRKLKPIECHDLMCKIAEIVVVGGVRRSAMISLSDLEDSSMAVAKAGAWWEDNPQRALANNSVCYVGPVEMGTFMKEWLSLYESKSGERGIFNRDAAKAKVASLGRRDTEHDFGCNPCSEIILRPKQFCNLSEVIVRAEDTVETLKRKVGIAAILGTLQATLTKFSYLSKGWRDNTAEEALLGVSLTGILDNKMMSTNDENLKNILNTLRDHAVSINKQWATSIGINPSAAVTCVKPSGTVSQLVDAASGIHTRHSAFYLRTVRGDNKDPITAFLKDSGVYSEPDVMKPEHTTVFYFPMKAPDNAVVRDDLDALKHLNLWKTYQDEWCEHKPSVTISVKEHEWMDVGSWIWNNFNTVSGVSFLPHSEHSYRQAPYQEITEEQYLQWMKDHPEPAINWDDLSKYEQEDNTAGSQTYACSGGACEIVDLVDETRSS